MSGLVWAKLLQVLRKVEMRTHRIQLERVVFWKRGRFQATKRGGAMERVGARTSRGQKARKENGASKRADKGKCLSATCPWQPAMEIKIKKDQDAQERKSNGQKTQVCSPLWHGWIQSVVQRKARRRYGENSCGDKLCLLQMVPIARPERKKSLPSRKKPMSGQHSLGYSDQQRQNSVNGLAGEPTPQTATALLSQQTAPSHMHDLHACSLTQSNQTAESLSQLPPNEHRSERCG